MMTRSADRRLYLLPLATLSLLVVPLIAGQLSEEVNWTGGDFLMMGSMLLIVGTALLLIFRWYRRGRARAIGIVLTLLLFLLVWAELAVGVFGTPFAGS